VHEVFNELWIQKILEILCNHDNPYLDECAATHIKIGKFLSKEKLPAIKEAFRLYLMIRGMHRDNPHPCIPILEKDVNFFVARNEKWRKDRPTDFVVEIKKAIVEELEAYRNFQEILYSVAKVPEGSQHPISLLEIEGEMVPPWPFEIGLPTSELADIFDVFDVAEIRLNTLKQNQLTRFADLLDQYPNYLHTCCEKDEGRRNQAHNVARLRLEAKRMPMRQIVYGKQFGARSIFSQKQFFLVPYNRSVSFILRSRILSRASSRRVLRTFLKILQRFPPEKHRYPDPLNIVLEGFARHHARTPDEAKGMAEILPKVLHTKYSLPEYQGRGGAFQPEFFLDEHYPTPRNLKRYKSIWPFSEGDFEWLVVFLLICDHMSAMQEPWTIGRPVAEYWKKHAGEAKG
jgi:hypothetical protein